MQRCRKDRYIILRMSRTFRLVIATLLYNCHSDATLQQRRRDRCSMLHTAGVLV